MIFKLSRTSLARLDGVHPDLVAVVKLAITLTDVDFRVNEGVRSRGRQIMLKRTGKSMTLNSRHLRQEKSGFGEAVDLCAVGDLNGDGMVDTQDWERAWDRHWYRSIAIAMQAAADRLGVGIRWGGHFKLRNGKPWWDGPHFELRS